MNTEIKMIPIEHYLKDFKQYLDTNSRCILSSKFGNGKSYFINSFIKEYSEEYLFIPIYPVNYQVMDNKDIFELIKRDILIKLLSSDEININEIELNTSSLFYSFFITNPEDRFFDILSIIPDINIPGFDINICNVIKKIKEVKDKFDAYKEPFMSVDKTSELYITQFDSLKGTIYEFDTISQLICDIIQKYKEQHSDKKVVLIIEDLDRIDPAHIFRILNVFSAHFDRYTPGIVEFETTHSNNKFCLDKIVSVCDIYNLKNIYAHVYGEKTDFIGYISKFSNSKEYIYSLKEQIKWYITNVLLDQCFIKYPQICDILSDMIISSMEDKKEVESNLRIIKERISKSSNLIRVRHLELNNKLSGKYITSDSDFTKLLALLKAFGFDFNNIDIAPAYEEFVKIVGKYWILASLFEEKIDFILENKRIDVYYNRERYQSYWEWQTLVSIDNCIDDKQILDFDISSRDAKKRPKSYIFDQMHNIVDHLNREFIIN